MYTLRPPVHASVARWIDTQIDTDGLIRIVLYRLRGKSQNAVETFTADELEQYENSEQAVDAIIGTTSFQSGGTHRLMAWFPSTPDELDLEPTKKQRPRKQIDFTASRQAAGTTGQASGAGAATETLGATMGQVATMMSDQAAGLASMVADGQRETTQLVIDLMDRHGQNSDTKTAEILRLTAENVDLRSQVRELERELDRAANADTVEDRLKMIDGVGTMLVNAATQFGAMYMQHQAAKVAGLPAPSPPEPS